MPRLVLSVLAPLLSLATAQILHVTDYHDGRRPESVLYTGNGDIVFSLANGCTSTGIPGVQEICLNRDRAKMPSDRVGYIIWDGGRKWCLRASPYIASDQATCNCSKAKWYGDGCGDEIQ